MPSRAYDPRRYGPTVSTVFRDGRSAPGAALSEAWDGRGHDDNLHIAKSLRGTRAKRPGVGLCTESQRGGGRVGAGLHEPILSSDDGAAPKEDRFRRPGKARAALAPRSGKTRTALFSKGPGATKHERSHLHHTELSPFGNTTSTTTAPASLEFTTTPTADTTASASASDTAGAASPGARGRTRRRSLSWHLRQRMSRLPLSPASTYSSSLYTSPAAGSRTINSYYSSSSGGGGYEAQAPAGREKVARQKGRGRRRRGKSGRAREWGEMARGESIDAEELFRRKNKMSAWNVTYGRWAENYDRNMARRASLERRERLELQWEENERRRRAEEEFQKWLRSHARRSSSSPSSPAAATATAATSYASASAAAHALGPRSSYQERAASASPRRRQCLRRRQEAWTDGDGEWEQDGAESEGLGGTCDRNRTTRAREAAAERQRERDREKEREEERGRQREREQDEEKRRKVDRAFRVWLDRKKRQAQAEREARQRREEALVKHRKLEASRRWKKRPVVCAYTYGAKIGARKWKDEPSTEEDGRHPEDVHDHEQQGEDGDEQRKQGEHESRYRSDGEEGGGDGDGQRPLERRPTENRTDEETGRRGNGSPRRAAGEGAGDKMAEEHDCRLEDGDQRVGGVLQGSGKRERKLEHDEERAEDKHDAVDETDKRVGDELEGGRGEVGAPGGTHAGEREG